MPDVIEALLADRAGVADAVAALRAAAYAVVSGRGLMMGTALETALKLEETCLRPVRGYSYADLRHGPISVVTHGHDRRARRRRGRADADADDRARRRPAGRGATVVGIGGDDRVRRGLRRPRARSATCPRHLRPLGAIVPAQLVVEALARALGLDPDNPAWPGQGHPHRPTLRPRPTTEESTR